VPATLKQILLAPQHRQEVVSDLQHVVDTEVSSTSGMSGLAIKGSYAVVKKVKHDFVPHAINQMLPEFVAKLEPYYADYDPEKDGSLHDYLAAQSAVLSDVLLAVSDRRARMSHHETVKRAYRKIRPQAKRHVEAALPSLAAVIERHQAIVEASGELSDERPANEAPPEE
jgi:hypothetical protein